MAPEDPGTSSEDVPEAPAKRSSKSSLFIALVLAAAAGAFFLMRRPAAAPAGATPGSAASKAPAAGVVVEAPVKLSAAASLVSDRFRCLCGECHDTLGSCTCTRDKGSNEMKTTLNRIAAEKKTIAEIEAAMVQKYGPGVLIASTPAPSGR
ncbi:MAG TPA: hypothetical protein VGR67_00385 [Candidatus Polarisedimenticolia bacterium]|jgi:hypothetical protein|nr:hypothetical protein [Candidatus Polarisedimenticolia bacterium]